MVITPPGGKWGDDNASAKMLQMTHDPLYSASDNDDDSDSSADAGGGQSPYTFAPACTADSGKVLTEHDPGYDKCMAKRRVTAKSRSADSRAAATPSNSASTVH